MNIDNESDVEQKLIWQLLTDSTPEGLGYSVSDIKTKPSIRQFSIGKGKAKKLYYPDYVVLVAGLPMMVVEAKSPDNGLETALHEARLYANELNALYPHGVNPCTRVLACNGKTLSWTKHDQGEPEGTLPVESIDPTSEEFAVFTARHSRSLVQADADVIRSAWSTEKEFQKPVSQVGGSAFQTEELAQNTFGATIVGDYGRIFNPASREDRRLIAEHAYISSTARARLIEPIDRMIRNAVAPSTRKIEVVKDSANPKEVISKFETPRKLEDQLLLIVGSVGAGKSTFVDHLSYVALPDEIRRKTIWLRLNLNDAPLDPETAYKWIYNNIVTGLQEQFTDYDFYDLEFLNNVYSRELAAFKSGPVSMLDPESIDYKIRIVDFLNGQIADAGIHARTLATYFSTSAGRLLVITLDNCDKRNSTEQLTIFQFAQWMQSEFKCLTVLPIRDVTFELYRSTPPLDTALKQFVFRIEPPAFSDVLQARVRLVLQQMSKDSKSSGTLSYQLPNGIKVAYDAKDQSVYLASMLRSLYAHDRLVRQIMTGLAGRDVRRALEIFLDFCKSGHIGEDEIFEIRRNQGNYELSLDVVTRVLLRTNYKFYSGERSHLKNLIQCFPEDPFPDHFVRIAVLRWFDSKKKETGPAGVEGFHRVQDAISYLVVNGHDAVRLRHEIAYLVRERCLIAEHLRLDDLEMTDLAKISSSGVVHLQLLANPEYVAACAEDTYISDSDISARIAQLISTDTHFNKESTARIVEYIYGYLKKQESYQLHPKDEFIDQSEYEYATRKLIEIEAAASSVIKTISRDIYIGNVEFQVSTDGLRTHFESLGLRNFEITLPKGCNGKSNRGYGFLKLSSDEELKMLINSDIPPLRGRPLKINYDSRSESELNVGQRSVALSNNVFVGYFPKGFSEQQLRRLLADAELTAQSIKIIKKKENPFPFAFIEFLNIDEASAAIGSLNGNRVGDRILTASPARPIAKNN